MTHHSSCHKGGLHAVGHALAKVVDPLNLRHSGRHQDAESQVAEAKSSEGVQICKNCINPKEYRVDAMASNKPKDIASEISKKSIDHLASMPAGTGSQPAGVVNPASSVKHEVSCNAQTEQACSSEVKHRSTLGKIGHGIKEIFGGHRHR